VHSLFKWVAAIGVWVPVVIACGAKNGTFQPPGGDDSGASVTGDDGSTSGSTSSSSGSTYLPLLNLADAQVMTADSKCKGGHYQGSFTGTYTSSLTGVGFPIPVSGNVDMTLYQEGSAMMTCTLNGEMEDCSNYFSLQNGTITGVADGTVTEAGITGGFPYFCKMTGTLDCAAQKLVNGWIECTYCVGQLADGGMMCAPLISGIGGGIGGMFAGPLTAGYDYTTLAFTNGTWNGAEALCPNMVCNDGMPPFPDGGKSVYNYISDSGTYLGPGDFGGSGTWTATWQ
jgi:hypothetical protein